MINHCQKGLAAEIKAKAYLEAKNHQVLEQRYRNKLGEIDLITRKRNELFFVEVKYRSSLKKGHPFESVTFRKRQKLRMLARSYLKYKKLIGLKINFLVISLSPNRIDEFLLNPFDQ